MDPIDTAMAPVFDLPDTRWQTAVDDLCGRHPDLAAEIRRRFRILCDSGLAPAPPAAEPVLPERLGDYAIGRVLGEGGMGIVCEARHEPTGRLVAVKFVRPGNLLFGNARERFRREIEAVARLAHPGIVPVLAFGETQGVPYFAMERLLGASLGFVQAATAGRPPATLTGADLRAIVRRAAGEVGAAAPAGADPFAGSWTDAMLTIAIRVADALAHAHAHGVVHRDVKPGNIVVTADGRVVLLDFGLATAPDVATLTHTGSELGSIPYMAPEVFAGRAADARSDQYGLAVVLWELLAGRHPFLSASRAATRERAALGGVPSLRAHNRAVPRDLASVLAVALDPDPARRHGSLTEFAAELVRVQQRQPVNARPAPPLQRLLRWARRRPALATSVLLAVLLVVGTPTAIALGIASQRDRARLAERASARLAYEANIAAANTALQLGEDAEVRRRLDGCPPDLRGFEWRHLQLAVDGSLRRLQGHRQRVVAVAMTDDADRLASADDEGALLLWRPLTDEGARRVALPPGAVVERMAFADGPLRLVVVARDRSALVVDPTTAAITATRPPAAGEQITLASDAGELLVTRGDFALERVDTRTFAGHGRVPLTATGAPPHGRMAAAGGWLLQPHLGDLQAWRLADGRAAPFLDALPSAVLGFAAGADGTAFLSTTDRQILVVDPGQARRRTLVGAEAPIDSLALDRTGRFLVGVGADAALRTWRTDDGRLVAMSHGTTGGEHALAIASQRALVAVGGEAGTLQLFALCGSSERQVLHGHSGSVGALAVTADGRLLSGSEESSVRSWQADSGLPTAVSYAAAHWINALAVAPDGRHAYACYHGSVVRLRLPDLALADRTNLPAGWITQVLPLADGRLFVATSNAGITLFAEDGVPRHAADLVDVQCAVLERDGAHAFVGCRDGLVRVAVGAGVEPVLTIPVDGQVRALALGDERTLYAAEGMTLCARAVADGAVRWRRRCLSPATSLCLLADGTRVASGHVDGTVCLWDVTDGHRTILLRVGETAVRAVVADPRGHWLAAAGENATVTVFRAGADADTFAARLERAEIAAATRLDQDLHDERVLRADVLAAIDALPHLDAGIRARMRAIEALRPPVTWEAVSQQYTLCTLTGRPADHYEKALRIAAAAIDFDPTLGIAYTTAALAELRLGRPQAALQRADTGLPVVPQPANQLHCALHAVRAMALHALGRTELARDALATMRRLAAAVPDLEVGERQLHAEAERTVRG